MRITITNGTVTMQRGNSKDERQASAQFIMENVRCRYTPQSKQRAKEYARSQA